MFTMASSLLVCSLILTFVGMSMAVTCSERSSFGSYTTYKYCPYSCCGTSSFKYCCGSGTSTAVIIGIVIGVISLVAFVVGIIICCVCCLRSSQGHRGQVMRSHQPHVTVVSAGTTNAAYSPGYPMPAYPGQPQPGAAYYPPPTAYSPPSGSAYPSPAPAAGFAAPPPAYPAKPQPGTVDPPPTTYSSLSGSADPSHIYDE